MIHCYTQAWLELIHFLPYQRTGIYQTFLDRHIFSSNDLRLVEFAEAAFSPLKYALFQSCGYAFVSSVGIAVPPAPITSCLKIGAIGGIILTFFYFALLLRKRRPNRLYSEDSIASYVANLVKEIIYSVLAACLGVMGCGRREEMRLFMLVGALGPIVATVVIVALLGLVAGMVWSLKRLRDWRAAYWWYFPSYFTDTSLLVDAL